MKHYKLFVKLMIVATVLVALTPHFNSATADGDLVEINAVGSWTLSELGYGALEQTLESREERFTLARYLLPEDARQGGGTWYIVYLHLSIEFGDEGSPRQVQISASTNGLTAIQVLINQLPMSNTVVVDNLEFINGHVRYAVEGKTLELHVANFMLLAGAQPGENTLTFKVEQFVRQSSDLIAKKVHVFEDSSVIRTAWAPPALALDIDSPRRRFTVKDEIPLLIRLNSLGLPAKDVSVRVESVDGLEVLGEDNWQLAELSGEEVLSLRVIGQEAGTRSVRVIALGQNVSRKTVEAHIPVDHAWLGQPRTVVARWTVVSGLLGLGLISLWGSWRLKVSQARREQDVPSSF
jgi:hypothetical protein